MMSDVEEPPSKISKIDESEMEAEFLEEEEEQEEWLSEELLTDDDGIPEDESNMNQISQDESTVEHLSESITDLKKNNRNKQGPETGLDDGDTNSQQHSTFSDELDAFLIRKTDGTVVESKKVNSESEKMGQRKSEAEEDGDGNSTDDLLRMLGDDDDKEKRKKMVKKASRPRRDESTDDEGDGATESPRITRLRVAKNALVKNKPAKKAEPEDLSDSDMTSDEINTMKNIFVTKKGSSSPIMKVTPKNQIANASPKNQPVRGTPKNQPAKATPKNQTAKATPKNRNVRATQKTEATKVTPKNQNFKTTPKSQIARSTPKNQPTKATPKETIVYVKTKNQTKTKSLPSFDPPKRIGNVTITPKLNTQVKNEKNNSISKPDKPTPKSVNSTKKNKSEPAIIKSAAKVNNKAIKSAAKAFKSEPKLSKSAQSVIKSISDDFDEIIDEEEFLEDNNDYGLDELLEDTDDDDAKVNITKQHIMKPEVMDEEVPSDMESNSEAGDVYDSSGVESAYAAGSVHNDMPSSDYEDELDEWFTLDLRAERAGEYIPLLGPRAYQLLLDEKNRVTSRLESLRKSLSHHKENGKSHKEQLKHATATLAELDAMLVAL